MVEPRLAESEWSLQKPSVLAIVLAGGEGRRLFPLTRDRAKPAVPFGGQYRLIDFVLSNLVNSGVTKIVVLTQYKSHSLNRHLAQTWRLSPLLGNYVAAVPAQMRVGKRWFEGSADAIYQNLDILKDENPDYVLVFGSDHIYRMDAKQLLKHHAACGAGVTVAAIPVPTQEASEFGVIDAGPDGQIRSFQEKPEKPAGMPGNPGRSLVSMGNYVFTAAVLSEVVRRDADMSESRHDMGGNIIPMLVDEGRANVYDFSDNVVPGQTERERGYWRDVGTLDSYYKASMDLVEVEPVFDLYNNYWPIFSWQPPLPPAKFVHDEEGRRGVAVNSLVSKGVVVSGGTVRRSILSPYVRINSYAMIEDSVLLDGVEVGRGALIRRAIIDKNVKVPAGLQIGINLDADGERFTISEGGVVLVGKNEKLNDV